MLSTRYHIVLWITCCGLRRCILWVTQTYIVGNPQYIPTMSSTICDPQYNLMVLSTTYMICCPQHITCCPQHQKPAQKIIHNITIWGRYILWITKYILWGCPLLQNMLWTTFFILWIYIVDTSIVDYIYCGLQIYTVNIYCE